MSKLWRYKGYDPDKRRIKDGFEYKIPEIFISLQPDEDYEDVTTEDYLISKEARKYSVRENVGKEYASIMDARLIILGNSIPLPFLSEQVRSLIDTLFKGTRDYLYTGRWISARREIDKVVPDEDLESLVNQFGLPIYQELLIQEIKDYINLQIEELY